MAVKNKSYLNNPALQFISSSLVEEATQNAEPAEAAAAAAETPVRPAAPETPAAVAVSIAPARAQEAFEVPMKPVYVEVRSKRFNALMQPSLYRNLSRLAEREGISVNELMHRALEEYVEKNRE